MEPGRAGPSARRLAPEINAVETEKYDPSLRWRCMAELLGVAVPDCSSTTGNRRRNDGDGKKRDDADMAKFRGLGAVGAVFPSPSGAA